MSLLVNERAFLVLSVLRAGATQKAVEVRLRRAKIPVRNAGEVQRALNALVAAGIVRHDPETHEYVPDDKAVRRLLKETHRLLKGVEDSRFWKETFGVRDE